VDKEVHDRKVCRLGRTFRQSLSLYGIESDSREEICMPFATPLATLVLLMVAGGFVYLMFQMIGQGAEAIYNAQMPHERRPAHVVTKRTEVWGEHSRTNYYVTFQLTDGQRVEYQMDGKAFGMIVEGDEGALVTQGTAYRGFERSA
jgi:hypothetical protein